MTNSITTRMGLLLSILVTLVATASADIPPGPAPRPQLPVIVAPPENPGLPDIRLEKHITATLADQGKGTTLRIPKAWLTVKTSTTQPDNTLPGPHAAAERIAHVQTTLAGLLIGAILMIGSWQLLRRRPINSTFLSLAGAAIVVLLVGAAQADIAPRPTQNPDPSILQVAPNQAAGPITLETTDTGDEATLIISRDVVLSLSAKVAPH